MPPLATKRPTRFYRQSGSPLLYRAPSRELGLPDRSALRAAVLRGPEPERKPRRGRIAQLVEQLTLNQRVAGSSPAAPTRLRSRSEQGCRAEARRAKAGGCTRELRLGEPGDIA